MSRKTPATEDERNHAGIKEMKERLTVLAYANAAGTHRLKLLMIGKSAKPCFLDGIMACPCICQTNKQAWITREIFQD